MKRWKFGRNCVVYGFKFKQNRLETKNLGIFKWKNSEENVGFDRGNIARIVLKELLFLVYLQTRHFGEFL